MLADLIREGSDWVCALGPFTYLIHNFESTARGFRVSVTIRRGVQILNRDSVALWSEKRRREFAKQSSPSEAERIAQDLIALEAGLRRITQDQQRQVAERQTSAEAILRETPTSLLGIHAAQAELTSSSSSHDLIELALATVTSLSIAQGDESALVWLLAVGAPSSDKTATVMALADMPNVYRLDTLTENAFISGYLKADGSAPEDLLAELGGHCLLVKDYTTLFSLKEDTVKKILGDLQSIYDGEFTKFMGTRGRVRHEARFSHLGCITPLALSSHHRYMAMIGGRFLFCRVLALSEAERREGFEIAWDRKARGRLREFRRLVSAYGWQLCQDTPILEEETPEQQEAINRLALLLARGRSVIRSVRHEVETKSGKVVTVYEPEEVQTEEPWRAFQQLRNLGRALALVHRRDRVTGHEIELLRRVVLSSMPVDRAEVLALYPEPQHLTPEGALTRRRCQEGIGKSYGRAKQLLAELVAIRLLRQTRDEGGEGEYHFTPVADFADLIKTPLEPLDHLCDLATPEGVTLNGAGGSFVQGAVPR